MQDQIIPKTHITGIVLAGGKSSRFGSDKALYEYRGNKLVEYSISVLQPLCDRLLISTNQPDKFRYTGLETIEDIYPGCGPVGGIHACLMQSATDHNLVIGCDMPWLNSPLFEFLLQNCSEYQVVMPMHDGFKETMASYYHKSCTAALEKALQEKRYKVFDAIAGLKIYYPEIDHQAFYSDRLFANVNYLKDIE
jgi:molybdenum cofactor guanylyltransferase